MTRAIELHLEMPLRPIRIAAQIHPQQGPWANLRRAAVEAEELGYDIAYNWDHFFPLYGERDGEQAWRITAKTALPAGHAFVGLESSLPIPGYPRTVALIAHGSVCPVAASSAPIP